MQGAGCRNPAVQLPQRTGRSISRIHETLFARIVLPLVERFKVRLVHDDFAAHLEDVGQLSFRNLKRNRADRLHVRRHVFPDDAVAADTQPPFSYRRLHARPSNFNSQSYVTAGAESSSANSRRTRPSNAEAPASVKSVSV